MVGYWWSIMLIALTRRLQAAEASSSANAVVQCYRGFSSAPRSRRIAMTRRPHLMGFATADSNLAAFHSSYWVARPGNGVTPSQARTVTTVAAASSLSGRAAVTYRHRTPTSPSSALSGRPTTMGASAVSTEAPIRTSKQPRPEGPAQLNFIDFNPDVPASGPDALAPVVIMHGLMGNARNFQGWGSKLARNLMEDRRIFAVDMRNHGSSSHHDSMTYEEMAEDVLAFMVDQGISKAVLIGHSMGGKVAAMTALLYPRAVEGLIIMDIAPVKYSMVDRTNWGETQKIVDAIAQMPLEGVNSRRDADALLAKDIVDPALRAFAVTNLDKNPHTGKQEWRINISAIHRSMGILAQFGSDRGDEGEGRLGRRGSGGFRPYHGDTLFIAGANSRYIRSQHLEEIRSLFPRYMLSTVKGAGHWVHADNPPETIGLALSFLDRPELG